MFPSGLLTSTSSLANAMAEFDAATARLGLSADQITFLKQPRCTLKLSLPVRMDGGRIRVFSAYHTIHSITRGPSIGGVQFRPQVTGEMVEAFAFWSTHRCALLGVPFSGSYGAVDCEPEVMSAGELERISRRYAAELSDLIKPNYDLLTADMGTNQQVMCWFMDTYSMHRGVFAPAVVLGKPVGLGGIAAPINLAAIGAELCIGKAAEAAGIRMRGAKVAIQGFGKVGMNVARLLSRQGAVIVGVSDVSGAYVNERGIAIDEAIWHQESHGILDGLEGEIDVAKLDDPEGLFHLPVDILVLAAIELQITEANVAGVVARVVAEIAHDPVSPGADRALAGRGAIVIPDILCSGGGIAGAYLEWVQNRMGYSWTAERVQEEVREIVGSAFDGAMAIAREDGIPLRLAAAVLAVKRSATASALRGVYA